MLDLATFAMIAALGQSPASSPLAPPVAVRQTYRVKQQGGGLGVFVDEAVVFHEVGEGAARVWVVERRRRDDKMGQTTLRYEWIDGRECPALADVLVKIGGLPAVSISGPKPEPRGWISDTPEVTLIGPTAGGREGDTVLQRDVGGAVSEWWWRSGKALETCWTPRKPYIAGAYDLRSTLSTAQGEVNVMKP